ncbi:carbohydrate ABC transporter permease, partial [Clavibacter michiganensis subsp. insidiosus]
MSTLTGTPLAAPDAGTPVRDAPAERTPKRRRSA